jgi:hypothetical protein
MEARMLDRTTVRRREDGSIDVDFYRRQGLAEHRAVMNRAIRSIGRRGIPFAILSTVAVTIFASTGISNPAPM